MSTLCELTLGLDVIVEGKHYRKTTRKLGEGSYSQCYLVEDENGASVAAGKFFSDTSSSRRRLRRFEKEVELMKQLSHSNIVKYLGSASGVSGPKLFSEEYLKGESVPFAHPPVMLLEFCSGGSLSALLKARLPAAATQNGGTRYGTLSEEETLWVAECVCRALVYLKERRIIHRDIKAGNLLLQSQLESPQASLLKTGIVLCDFGLSAQLGPGERYAEGHVGTPTHMSYEVVAKERAFFPADMWSLGVVLFTCLTGHTPFEGINKDDTYDKIKSVSYRWRTLEKQSVTRETREMIDDMLDQHAHDRPTPESLLLYRFQHRAIGQ